jgi:hypothetical protein
MKYIKKTSCIRKCLLHSSHMRVNQTGENAPFPGVHSSLQAVAHRLWPWCEKVLLKTQISLRNSNNSSSHSHDDCQSCARAQYKAVPLGLPLAPHFTREGGHVGNYGKLRADRLGFVERSAVRYLGLFSVRCCKRGSSEIRKDQSS